jgi:hypothetical protein
MATIEDHKQPPSVSKSGQNASPFTADHSAVQENHHHLDSSSSSPPPPPLPLPIGGQYQTRQHDIDNDNHHQQQHSTLQLRQISSTPWTLGSSEGAFAIEVMNNEKKDATEGVDVSMPPTTDGDPTGVLADQFVTASPALEEFATGARITTSGGDATHVRLSAEKSMYQDRLFHQSSATVEAVLAASCEVMGFDIAEMWLRTGPKTHQLTNSHLRPTALEDSVRKDLVDVYYGEKSSERTHRLSPALCKRAKEAGDVVWVTAHSRTGAEALRCSISNVRTAVAVPIFHESSNTNITIIFFSIRRYVFPC